MRTPRLPLAVAALACATVLVPASADAPGAWTVTLPATQGHDHLSAFADGTMYAQHLDSYAKSTDFGATWMQMPPPAGMNHLGTIGIRFSTPKVGYAITGATSSLVRALPCPPAVSVGYFRTTDGGATWSPMCEPASPKGWQGFVSSYGVGKDGRTIALLGHESIEPFDDEDCRFRGAVWTSTDRGTRWTRAQLPEFTAPGWAVSVYDVRNMAAIFYRFPDEADSCAGNTSHASSVFVTSDGGRSWREALRCDEPTYCTAVAMVTPARLLVGRSDGTTDYSNDAGRRWFPGVTMRNAALQPAIDSGQVNPNYFWVQAFSFVGQAGFASTRGGGTWRTEDGGRSWTQERSHECDYRPWGIGEVATADPAHAITGGPTFIGARLAAPVPPLPCPSAPIGDLPVPGLTVARLGDASVRADAGVTRGAS